MDEKTIARFWSKVDRSAGPDGCWLWTASKEGTGYGNIRIGSCVRKAHRVAWELTNGTIPRGPDSHGTMCVCHRCDVPLCVNPAHLFLGTNSDNMADMVAKGRHAGLRGETHGSTRISVATVRAIRADHALGMTTRKLGAKYGVSGEHARQIALGMKWASLKETA